MAIRGKGSPSSPFSTQPHDDKGGYDWKKAACMGSRQRQSE